MQRYSLRFILAPYIVVLDFESQSAFKESSQLIKPFSSLAGWVALGSLSLMVVPDLVLELIIDQETIVDIVKSLIDATVGPFELCVILLFYIKIKDTSNSIENGVKGSNAN